VVRGGLLVFRKERALTKRGGRVVADLLRGALAHSRVENTRTIKPEFCLEVDVFHEGVHLAPRGRKRLGIELESACRQIATLWPAIGTRAACRKLSTRTRWRIPVCPAWRAGFGSSRLTSAWPGRLGNLITSIYCIII
jgi:hypothetical protein